jgi:lipopolysaccharide/colanic/teichoic acid biosynthesis glycosyltransferase
MPILSPSSRVSFRPRLSLLDVLWAAFVPPLALYIPDAYILHLKFAPIIIQYCSVSFGCSLIAYSIFRISDNIPQYFSLPDVINVVKASLTASLLTNLIVFSLSRLNGIPRATPILAFMILTAGLIVTRTIVMRWQRNRLPDQSPRRGTSTEHIILIGTNSLSSLYIKMIHALSPVQQRITAVLDQERSFIGRSMCGVPVVASSRQLDLVIDEYETHGVPTDRVVIAGDKNLLSEIVLNQVRAVCTRRNIRLDFVPELIGLSTDPHDHLSAPISSPELTGFALPSRLYFKIKRLIDFVLALMAIVLLSPLLVLTCAVILADLGFPLVFWQQRMGRNHKNFFLYKFRTLRPPFDASGRKLTTDQRLSLIGRGLRAARIDELPQLFNVLVGDMSLIGPRPLLPHDQPKNMNIRLSVRPGITGWAQVNGGNLITTEEKGALDEWYVRNVSLWLDLRIALHTLRFLYIGEVRSEEALDEARSAQRAACVSEQNDELIEAPMPANENRSRAQSSRVSALRDASGMTGPLIRIP